VMSVPYILEISVDISTMKILEYCQLYMFILEAFRRGTCYLSI
jgi:hypothetical protein